MYKLLIVEDEVKIRDGLANSVQWQDIGYTVAGLAANGREALKLVEQTSPDVILTDVHMPEMDGLELMEVVRKCYSNIHVIMLSGFAEFEYARKAVKLSADDYLLKPTNKKTLITTFKSLKQKLDDEVSVQDQRRASSRQVKQGVEKYKEHFLKKLLHGEYRDACSIQDQLNTLEINLAGEQHCVCSLLIDLPSEIIKRGWRGDKDLITFSYNNIISELLERMGGGAVYVPDLSRVSIIFSFSNSTQRKLILSLLQEAAMQINILLFGGRAKIFGGVGNAYASVSDMHASYAESQVALDERFFHGEGTFFCYKKEPASTATKKKNLVKTYREDSNRIVNAALRGDKNELMRLLSELSDALSTQPSVKDIKNYFYVLCFLLESGLAEFEMHSPFGGEESYKTFIERANSMNELTSYIQEKCLEIAAQTADSQMENTTFKHRIIEDVKEYIRQNYKQNVTLKAIGDHVHLSPSYISFLFKEVTGDTYTEYLKYVRIQNAKKLLKHVNLKVYEIAALVGYSDYKYFTSQFKKITGISPTEYRDQREM